jgi:hypothetical protein
MAGDEDGVVAVGPQALRDAVEELLVIAAGKISAAHAAGKQHIAYKAQFSSLEWNTTCPGV